MRLADDNTLKTTPRTGRKHEAVRNEVMQMHLFDENAAKEMSLCREDSSSIERMSVGYYLEERLCGRPIGAVCERCKALVMSLADDIIEEMAEVLEEEGRFGDAEDCRELFNTLAGETVLNGGPD